MLTRAGFFQGHEWLTFFGNQDLPSNDRFDPSEIHLIAEGNRRVDWPKELLYHMNNGVIAYVNALTEHTDQPKNQRLHFLLTDKNSSAEAAAEGQAELRKLSVEALRVWITNRKRSLTWMGKSLHLIQDAYSEAHTRRNLDHVERPGCIVKVKAYIRRAPGFETSDIEYHGGGDDDVVGHTTVEDSIYREGRECHEPEGFREVEACLSEPARLARSATRDYLALMRKLVGAKIFEASDLEQRVEEELQPFVDKHLSLCP